MERTAIISDCCCYRYLLTRTWEPLAPSVLYIMLNPSTADAEIDDPTVKSCIRLAKGLCQGGLEIVNLFAWRATNPDDILKARDPIGPDNDKTIQDAVRRCNFIICAWGAYPAAGFRARKVLKLISETCNIVPMCFGLSQKGAPRHPLYIKSGTPLILYRG